MPTEIGKSEKGRNGKGLGEGGREVQGRTNFDNYNNDFEKYLKKFIGGKTTKITFDNLDSYLYGLDQLKYQENKQTGADSIFKWKKSWRELLFEVTEIDYPREFNPSYIDESNIEIVKSVLESFLIASMGESKEESTKRLNILNEFIKTYINV